MINTDQLKDITDRIELSPQIVALTTTISMLEGARNEGEELRYCKAIKDYIGQLRMSGATGIEIASRYDNQLICVMRKLDQMAYETRHPRTE